LVPTPVFGDANETLMLRFRDGDVRAFEILLQRHRQSIFEFILRSVGPHNVTQAEDLTQETFLRVVKQASAYEQRAKFTTWLFTLARNLCIDASRRRKHRKTTSLDSTDEEGNNLLDRTASGGPAVDRQVIGHQLQARLEEAISSLPEDQREVFLMRESADLSFKEIADVIGVSENTVKSRMRYALEKLRASLDEYQDMARALP
jgi:RNA polymerase sigma-70 factor (ECF subfamily)